MSSNTDNTTKEWRDEISPERRGIMGAIRRMAVRLTDGTAWQLLGHLLLDSKTREARNADLFSGVGFYARPAPGANAEAIVVFPGGAANPVIIAVRDEDARRAIANLDQDSTAMFNRSTIILIKPDGTVEIRAAAGTPHPLPTLAEFNDFVSKFNDHTHLETGGTTNATSTPASAATGTTILKAQ